MAVRRNLVPNPACKNNTTGNATSWVSTPSGYARQTSVTSMTRTTGFGGSSSRDVVTTPRFAATAGLPYMASVQVKTGSSNTFKVMINWYDGSPTAGNFISSTATTSFTVNGVQRVEIGPFTAPTGAGAGYVRIIELDSTTVTLTALMVEQTNVAGNAYFDGDSTGAAWEGTNGNSTSILTAGNEAATWADAGSVFVSPSGPVGQDVARLTETGTVAASSTTDQGINWFDAGMIFSVDYDPRRGRNRIFARGMPAAGVRAVVESRPESKTAWRTVRGGKVSLSNGAFTRTVDDYEFVAGRDNTYRIRVISTPENVDEITISSVVVTLAATNPGVWLKFIVQPALNQQVQLIDWSEVSRPSRVSLYDVVGRTDPVAVTDVHSSRRVTVKMRTQTNDEADQLDAALSQGRPLFLHVPDPLALPSMYAVAGDYSSSRPVRPTLVRHWEIQLIEVSPPPASAVAPPSTWQTILDSYATWQDVIDAFPTWQDVVS